MELSSKSIALIVAAAAIGGAYLDRQVSSRTITVDHDVIKNHVITVTKEIIRPDGTIEKDTKTSDTSTKTEDKKTTVVSQAPQWFLGVSVLTPINEPVYQLDVNRRIVGPVFIGGSISTNRTVGLKVGIEF